MARGNQKIAPTAHYTAQAWVQSGFPEASRFDTATGRRLFNSLHVLTLLAGRFAPPILRYHEEYLFVRHNVFETRLRQIKPDYVLEVGAGLSPRGITYTAEFPDLIYVEADLPNMVAAKKECLRGYTPAKNYHLTTIDLLGPSFIESLPLKPRKGSRILLITEGVTDYLSMGEKRTAWGNLSNFLREFGGGHYLFEIHPRERYSGYAMQTRFYMTMLGSLVGRSFEDRVFSTTADALQFLKGCGFDDARELDSEALNTTRYRPPMRHCAWTLLEGRVGAQE